MPRQHWKRAFASTLASLITAGTGVPLTALLAQTSGDFANDRPNSAVTSAMAGEMLSVPAGLQGLSASDAGPAQFLPFAHFNIPFDIDTSGRPPAEVYLWVSPDSGRSWLKYGSTSPERRQFEFRAAAEGEYLFAVQTRDTRGDSRLASGPPMRVLIDTTKPLLEMTADLDSAARVVIQFQITDPYLNEDSIALAFALDGTSQWQEITNTQIERRGDAWRGQAEIEMPRCRELEFKLVAKDKAQNSAEQLVRYATPRTAAASPGMQLASNGSHGANGSAEIRALDARPIDPRATEVRSFQPRTKTQSSQDPRFGDLQDDRQPLARMADRRFNLSSGEQDVLIVGAQTTAQPKELRMPSESANSVRAATRGIAAYPAIAVQPETQSSRRSTAMPVSPTPTQSAPTTQPLTPTQGAISWEPNAAQPSMRSQRSAQTDTLTMEDATPTAPKAIGNFPTAPIGRTASAGGGNEPNANSVGMSAGLPAQRGIPIFAEPAAEELPSPAAQEDRANERIQLTSREDATARTVVEPSLAPTAPPASGSATAVIEEATALPSSTKDAYHSRSRSFSLDYAIDSLRGMSVVDVELWGTEDRGNTWQKWGSDPDRQSPFDVQVGTDGLFGFRMVIIGENGMVSNRPHDGDAADMWINVDTKLPTVKITRALYGEGAEAGMLVIDYNCEDDNLHDRPITLSYSERPSGPWMTIASGVRNSGIYLWKADPNLPQQVYLRIQSVDRAGNIEEHRLELPINLRGLTPRGRIQGFRPIDTRP